MGDHNFKNANRATTADKSHYRTSAFWAGIHFTGNGVNRPTTATVCFDYLIGRGFGITTV
jgi:hypothetical protein